MAVPESRPVEAGPSAFIVLVAAVASSVAVFMPWTTTGGERYTAFDLVPSAVVGRGFFSDYPGLSIGALILVLSLGLVLSGFAMGTHAGSWLAVVCGGGVLALSMGWLVRLADSSLADIMIGTYVGVAGGILAALGLTVRWTRDSKRNRRELMLQR